MYTLGHDIYYRDLNPVRSLDNKQSFVPVMPKLKVSLLLLTPLI